jgi:predicted RNA-binding Zn-ribbon protein involved in translation (DUF1610 family)
MTGTIHPIRPKWNMYGHSPCPMCGEEHRCMFRNEGDMVCCDDCGFKEVATRKNSNEHSACKLFDEERW